MEMALEKVKEMYVKEWSEYRNFRDAGFENSANTYLNRMEVLEKVMVDVMGMTEEEFDEFETEVIRKFVKGE